MYGDSRNEAEAKPPEERLPPATVRQLVTGVEELEADLRRLRAESRRPTAVRHCWRSSFDSSTVSSVSRSPSWTRTWRRD